MTPEQLAARRAIKGVTPDTDIAGIAFTEEQKATIRETEARWAKQDAAEQLAARVLADVPRHYDANAERVILEADALAAIAKLGAGDGLVERLQQRDKSKHGYYGYVLYNRDGLEAAARIAALTAQNREMALDVLASSGQAQEAYAAQIAAVAERDALRAKVARLEGALTDMPKAVLRTTICQGPQWPDDRPGVWLAALEACAKSVQTAVNAAISDGGKDG